MREARRGVMERWGRLPGLSGTRATTCSALFALLGCSLFEGPTRDTGESSRILWALESRDNVGLPWFDAHSVYFLGRSHSVWAVDKRSGSVRWEVQLPLNRARAVGRGGFVIGDRLIVVDEHVFGLSVIDGRIAWEFAPFDGTDFLRDVPEYWNGMALVGSSNGNVLGVDVEDGTERWRARVAEGTNVAVYITPVQDGVLYYTTVDFDALPNGEPQGGIGALNATTGELKWWRLIPYHIDPLSPTATIDPVVVGSTVIAGSRDGPLYGFDSASGAQRWKVEPMPTQATEPKFIRDIRWLATCQGVVYAGSTSRMVSAINPATGQELWRTVPSPLGDAALVWCDSRAVFVLFPGGQLEVFEALSGRRLWAITGRDYHFTYGVAVDGDRFYGGGLYGLYAVRRD